jgi:transcription initiation factor IIE alpha subunit
MIINGFKCENCGEELQANDIGVRINEQGEIIRICRLCNHITIIEEEDG